MHKKVILVTGGAGFIGSHLTEHLLENQIETIVLDNFDTYYNPETKHNNVKAFKENQLFHLVTGDIRDKDVLESIFEEFSITNVVHLASMVGVRNSFRHPSKYSEVNIIGTVNLLKKSVDYKITNFTLASSSSVYGERTETPFIETDPTDFPISPYAATKKAAEIIAYSFFKAYNIPVNCLRFFTVYGPRGRPDMAVYKFIHNILSEKPIQQYGDGTSARDYTYVSDIIKGIISSLSNSRGFQIYNLGNSTPITLSTLIRTIESQIKKKAIIEILNNQQGDVSLTFADISKAKSDLGYNPTISLDEGIRRTLEWHNNE